MQIVRLSTNVPTSRPSAPPPQEEKAPDRWETFTRGAVEGAVANGLPALAGAVLPGGWGKLAGATLGAGFGLLHARGEDRQTVLRMAAGGAFNGLAAATLGSFFPVAGTIGMTVVGAGVTGYLQSR